VSNVVCGLFRLVASLLLLAVACALIRALTQLPESFDRRAVVLPTVAGFAIGLAVFTVICRFARVYVFGHELTHFMAAKLFLRRTKRFRVGETEGSIDVERPNIWIMLAPYFFPIYTIVWIGLYGCCRFFIDDPSRTLLDVVYAGVGLTYAYHVVLTFQALRRSQGDLREHGRMLSISLILFCNALLLHGCFIAAGGHWRSGPALLLTNLRQEWQWLCAGGRAAIESAQWLVAWVAAKLAN